MAGQGGDTHGDAAAPVQEGAHVARHAITTARHLQGTQAQLLKCIERRKPMPEPAVLVWKSSLVETGSRLPPGKPAGSICP